MIPFLLPLCLLLYGEFSKGLNTRYTSRILFYTYTLSVLFPLYTDNTASAIAVASCMLVIGLSYCIVLIPSTIGRIALTVALTTALLNYGTLFLQDTTFLFSIPYYPDYSHLIFRESLVIGVTASSIQEGLETKDFSLELFIASLWFYEHMVVV